MLCYAQVNQEAERLTSTVRFALDQLIYLYNRPVLFRLLCLDTGNFSNALPLDVIGVDETTKLLWV